MSPGLISNGSSHSQEEGQKTWRHPELSARYDDSNSSPKTLGRHHVGVGVMSHFTLLPAAGNSGGLERIGIPLIHGTNVVGRLPVGGGGGVVGCDKLRQDLGIPADAKVQSTSKPHFCNL